MKTAISFLRKLSKNNNSEWMRAHKDEYLAAKAEVEFLAQELITRIGSWDKNLPYLEPKDCTFRLNRDVRFSDDKRPYKENYGIFIGYGGKKGGLPGYYLHLSPKEVFVAGGVWMPEAPALNKIRRYISAHGAELEKILKKNKLDDEQKLVRPPKGFEKDHPHVEFLKHKSFILYFPMKKDEIQGKLIENRFKEIKPLNEFLLRALRGED